MRPWWGKNWYESDSCVFALVILGAVLLFIVIFFGPDRPEPGIDYDPPSKVMR